MSSTCRHCGTQIWRDWNGTWIDSSMGDVCGHAGGNEPHESEEETGMSETVRHPEVEVHLSTGQDASAFMIIGRVAGFLRRAGVSEGEIREFSDEAMSGDYDHVLATCMRWVNVT
jgi:hypothetical protein